MFGSLQVGAIHGRLLTAWSVAGIVGPTLVTYIRDYQIAHGVAPADAYSVAFYLMVGVLAVGLLCNLTVRPVDARHHVPAVVAAPVGSSMAPVAEIIDTTNPAGVSDTAGARIVLAWAIVLIPLLWGVYQTLTKSLALF